MKQNCIFDEIISRMMETVFNSKLFVRQLKQKRLIDEDIDMRTLAERISVSAATISRCEHGSMPDLDAYAKICSWLGQPLDVFIKVKTK
jgi:transcriptional regulator with XRE-family HTH domain